ncbi:MAG TPA: pilus assembly protein TadG-related protein [Pirellulales bacterium]|nr:pilus assembly protein TadG-related protein [Pirellulales bacterium]
MRTLQRLHRDQDGTISLLSVFSLLLLTMLLGMVMNVGRQVDRKVRMQNAADAATYSGGVMLARGMNSLAFTNHLICDVFALTAYMREARDRSSATLAPDALAAWAAMAPWLAASPFPKFSALGTATALKVPMEAEMVRSFTEWSSAASAMILPVLEEILAQELIPKYQRALVATMPQVAQMTAREIARQHGLLDGGRGDCLATLWRTTGQALGTTYDGPGAWMMRTLPVVDPISDLPGGDYFVISTQQRHALAHQYLDAWNKETLQGFDSEGQMSQFANFWRGFTCGKLDWLLDVENTAQNMLFVIRTPVESIADRQSHLEREFTWVGIGYRPQLRQTLPGLYRNPLVADDMAYAQVTMFIPRPRLVQYEPGLPPPGGLYGGVPGDTGPPPAPGEAASALGGNRQIWWVRWQNRPRSWDLLNQNWTVALVPATSASLGPLLSMPPPGFGNVRVRYLQGFTPWELQSVNMH